MKRYLIIFIILFSIMLSAQKPDAIKHQITSIQSQPDVYYFGYAEGRQRMETDQKALQEMMRSIFVVVSSQIINRTIDGENPLDEEELEKVAGIYTYGRLPDVKLLSYKQGPNFHIFRYIRKEDYRLIFENKKTEICGFLRDAGDNLKTNQLGKAFRNYYRAALAIEALPDGCVEWEGRTYNSEIIFQQIRSIARDIRINVVSNVFEHETRSIVLDFSHQGKPVHDLNIEYYDLHDFIPVKTNSNLLQIELYGKEYEYMEKLSLKIDLKENIYNSYNEQTQILSRLFEMEELQEYRKIPLKKKKVEQIKPKKRQVSDLNIKFINEANCPVLEDFAKNLVILFTMLENEYLDDETIFTDEKITKRLRQVIDCNHTKLLKYPQTVQINKTDVGWEARQFGVAVSCEGFPTRNETVVIDFDDIGRIYNFAYTINPTLHKLFETRGVAAGDWDFRQIAIKFLENYKTSYTTKNIEDVETLYSEDAIIITGKVVKRTKLDKEISTDFSDDEIIYLKKTKQEHIASQKEVFARNRFVWLQFDTFEISKAPVANVYGVSMKQNYYSITYKDEGYLFLLIDFRGDDPLIHVRNWQPGEWDMNKQMKLENFRFY
ncbi:MAG: hypothetical protein K9N07_02705 [Candidatus Cloacimonetes bacterium]|nr:hypothetical protein [Candidatus Cloacimonadota bacterium]